MWITVYEVIICFSYITVINHNINDIYWMWFAYFTLKLFIIVKG